MHLIYNLGIYLLAFFLKTTSWFNNKIKLGVKGRAQTFSLLKQHILPQNKTFWFHCASLGEYEQGLPVFEALKKKYPNYKIVLSFFSPSGFEVKKHNKIADVVVYLPLDSRINAIKFLDLVNPNLIVFVKYEVWPNYLLEIKRRRLRAVLISALFRKNQTYFKWYGSVLKKALFAFEHIFTQNIDSKVLLEGIGHTTVSVAGDTRFDRVYNQLKINNTIDFLNDFKQNAFCILFGSTWPEDEKLFIDCINSSKNDNLKFIIAPHTISNLSIANLTSKLKVDYVCYSRMKNKNLNSYKVFILDTIGYLSRAYSYADIAYVGGAAGKTGLHNILEPAVFGIPIIIGHNYGKFPEAKNLIALKGIISVTNKKELRLKIKGLMENGLFYKQTGNINLNYIKNNVGAVKKILNYICSHNL